MLRGLQKTEDREAPGEQAAWSDGVVRVREWLPDPVLLEELRRNVNLHASKRFTQQCEQIWYLQLFHILWFVFSLKDW